MRGLEGDDGQFSAADLGHSAGQSIIHSRCQEWLLRIELNLTDSEITFEAVKWAIYKLQCMEEQGQYHRRDYDSAPNVTEFGSSSSRHDELGHWVSGQSSKRLRSDRANMIDSVQWRNILIEAGADSCMDEHGERGGGSNSSDRDRRARVRKFVFSNALKEAVIAAEGGAAGRRMAERINARLDLTESVILTKLVSHCLLVSLDQTVTNVVRAAIASSARDSSRANEGTSDWMWLHRWFVRTLIPGRGTSSNESSSYIALDWLVAYLTASRGTITKLVLQDLIIDLQSLNDGDEQLPVATYIRRTGVLEYAALRKLRQEFPRTFHYVFMSPSLVLVSSIFII